MVVAHVAVVFDGGRGHTAQQAKAVCRGAESVAGTVVAAIPVGSVTSESWDELDQADAIIFGAPTYMGTASAAFHTFAESSSRRWLTQAWSDKLAAGFTNSSSKAGDKSSTLNYFATLAAQHGMLWLSLGLRPGWNSRKGSENDLNRLGFASGAAMASDIDSAPAQVHPADLLTAEHLGRRTSHHALLLVHGRLAMGANQV